MKFKKLLQNIRTDVRKIIQDSNVTTEEKLSKLDQIFSFLKMKTDRDSFKGSVEDCSAVLEELKIFIQPSFTDIGKDGFTGFLFTAKQVRAVCDKSEVKITTFNKFLYSKGWIQKNDHSHSLSKTGFGFKKLTRCYLISMDAFSKPLFDLQ